MTLITVYLIIIGLSPEYDRLDQFLEGRSTQYRKFSRECTRAPWYVYGSAFICLCWKLLSHSPNTSLVNSRYF